VLVLRIVESLGWVFGCSLGGERWDEKEEEGETEEESVGRWGYIMVFSDGITDGRNHRRNTSVGDAVGESATSLYGYLSLNPSVMSVGKIAWRHHAVAYFQTNCILRRQNRRYIPMDIFRQYITDGINPSVYTDGFGDGIISVGIHYRQKYSVGNSVTFLWFSGSDCHAEEKFLPC